MWTTRSPRSRPGSELTNKRYVFESRDYSPKTVLTELWKFTAGRLITFLIEYGFMLLTVDVLHWNDLIMKLIISVVVVILNYVFSKLFIFKKKERSDENQAELH